MARAPDPKYAEALKLYKTGKKLVEIAKQLELPEGTIRRWKCTHKWDSERSDSKSERSGKRGAPEGNKNAKGNKGGKGAPKGNKHTEKHGIFSKWLPEETKQIMGDLIGESPLDILWGNIMLQTAAIIRAQNIMNVTAKDEMIKELKKKDTLFMENGTIEKEEYIFQFAWDRQATFMNAQSRANATLQSMFRQYDEMLHKNWDLATEEQKARIEALKKQVKDDNKDKSINVVMDNECEGWGE